MLATLGVAGQEGVKAARGADWAAAVIPPPARAATSGADIQAHDGDILLWTGDIFLPPDWATLSRGEPPARAIGRALLTRLRRRGVESLAELDGAFCGAWFDGRNRQWVVFNDRVGMIPVFWSAGSDGLTIGPRAWATWRATGKPLEINPLGVALLLRTQNMVGENTLIQGVSWLGPGCALAWSRRACATRSYWDFRYDGGTITDPGEAADAYVAVLRQTVQQSTACDSPLLLGISGGLDSRLLLAMCAELDCLPACFTVGFPFGEDVRFGRCLARAAGTTHTWYPLAEHNLSARLADAICELDGLHNVAHLPPAVAVREYLAEHAGGVLLEGFFHGVLGGAEVAADDDVNAPRPPHQSNWACVLLHQGGSFELLDALLKPDLARSSFEFWRAGIDRTFAEAPTDDPLRRAEHTAIRGRLGRIETLGTAFLGRDVLLRTPGAHRAMVEWFQSVPPHIRRSRRLYVDVLRRRFPNFARVQRSNSSALPIAANRWLREFHWQREKLYRLWAVRRYPVLRKWGASGLAIRASTFETWRSEGGFDVLHEPEARVFEWVNRQAVMDLWNQALDDPLKSTPLMALITVETLVRRLESLPAAPAMLVDPAALFGPIETGLTDEPSFRSPTALIGAAS